MDLFLAYLFIFTTLAFPSGIRCGRRRVLDMSLPDLNTNPSNPAGDRLITDREIMDNLESLYPNNPFLDPCKSSAFMGDVALSDEERNRFLDRDIPLTARPLQAWLPPKEFVRDKRQFNSSSTEHSKLNPMPNSTPNGGKRIPRRLNRLKWRKYYSSLGLSSQQANQLLRRRARRRRIQQSSRQQSSSPRHSTNRTTSHRVGSDTRQDYVPRQDNSFGWSRSREARAATAYKARTWPDGVIPYVIIKNFTSETKATIMKAMRHWENYTCLSFVEREPQHKSYIIFTEKSCGCCSYVGRRNEIEPQAISIGKNCDKRGIIIHELGHVIGFWHEHTRPDRDDHVEILLENVVDGQDFNFKKMDPGEVNSLGEPYDYSSIMHYAKGTFAKANKDETIRPKTCCPRPPIGQRIQLSPGDIRQTIKLYDCPRCGRTLLESSGSFSSPLMDLSLNNKGWTKEINRHIGEDYENQNSYTRFSKLVDPNSGMNNKMVDDKLKKYGMQHDYMQSPRHYMNRTQLQFDTMTSLTPGDAIRPESIQDHKMNNRPMLCQWRINGASGERIQLQFTKMDVYGDHPIFDKKASSGVSDACGHDYVEVRDGYYSGAHLIGRYCGNEIPSMLISTGSRMWVEYRRSGKSKSLGFAAGYEAVCGGELRVENGKINSPSYPEFYKSNKKCVWKIIVPDGYSVALIFNSFQVERHETCIYDYVEIRDGLDETSEKLGTFCGMNLPPPIKSTNNKMYIKFVSDSSVEKQGFTASFEKEFDECKTINHGCAHICENTLGAYKCACHIGYELNADGKRCDDACGGVIKTTSGVIQTPSFPDLYPRHKSCFWKIIAPPKQTIILNFTHFDLEGTNKACNYDFIVVFSGPDNNRKKIGTYCGSEIPAQINSETNILTLEFYSDGSVQKTGFQANFVTDRDECQAGEHQCEQICQNLIGSYQCACERGYELFGKYNCKEDSRSNCNKEITQPEGVFSTPNWPEPYMIGQECTWKITATPGHRIYIEFDEFNTEAHQTCDYDRVVVYDGLTDNAPQLGKFCGSHTPKPVISTKSSMMIKFISDGSVQQKGFHAKYRTVTSKAAKKIEQKEKLKRKKEKDQQKEKPSTKTLTTPLPSNTTENVTMKTY